MMEIQLFAQSFVVSLIRCAILFHPPKYFDGCGSVDGLIMYEISCIEFMALNRPMNEKHHSEVVELIALYTLR